MAEFHRSCRAAPTRSAIGYADRWHHPGDGDGQGERAPTRLIREWASAGQAAAPGGALAEPGCGAGGQAAAGWRVTLWPRAWSLAIRRRVSRSGSRRWVK